jgi:ABC-type lipoprotein export system ATPase subunit
MNISSITLKSIKKSFNSGQKTINVFDMLSFELQKNNLYALTGASGVGKSTLLHIIAGLEPFNSGELYFDQKPINQLSFEDKNKIKNKNIGLVFQLPYLIDELSVLENVMLKGLIGGSSKKICKEMAEDLLFHVGLADKMKSFPSELSGGQQQRVAIARALLHKPDFLLADEPTGNLDEFTANQIVELLLSCVKQWSMGLIISTHDLVLAHQMQTVFIIKNGTITKEFKCLPNNQSYAKQ